MDFLDVLLWPEVVAGIVLGLAAAGIVHWLSPSPEPLLVEAGLVAMGFVGGLAVALASGRGAKSRR